MDVNETDVGDAVHIRVRDRLDVAKIQKIEAWLAHDDTSRLVILDFHTTRSLDDAALARLARGLPLEGRRVALRGLSERHHRLLRYVGLPRPGSTPAGDTYSALE